MDDYGAVKGMNEVQHISDSCPSSRYCSPLSCAVAFLARYKNDENYKEFFNSISQIEHELQQAKFSYPDCGDCCKFVDQPEEAERAMNNSIRLLKQIHLHGVALEEYEDEAHCEPKKTKAYG